VGSIEPYKTANGKRYRVRYRDPDRRSREKAGFLRKTDAEEYLASMTVSASRGEWVNPTAARTTVGELGPPWLASRSHLKPSSFRPLEIAWRLYVEPVWGSRRLNELTYSEVQSWVSSLGSADAPRSATTIIRAHSVLAGILDVAVRDRRIAANPARGVALPRKSRKPRAYLTHVQLEALAQNAGEQGVLIRLLGYTGLRWGELTGLRVRNVDLDRARVMVEENVVTVGGQLVPGSPKSHQARSVPFPRFLSDDLRDLTLGRAGTETLFGRAGGYLRRPDQRRGWFAAAVTKCQLVDANFPRVTPHDLRHTAASLAVSAGANVKVVQRMLGHASAAMTLDVYADLFDEDLESVSTRMAEQRQKAIGLPD
jgi:integrase